MSIEGEVKDLIYNAIQQASMLGSTYEDSAMSEDNYKIAFEKLETDTLSAILALTNLKPLEDRIKELEGVLEAWHTIFGTTQLTHAKDRLDVAERELEKLKRRVPLSEKEVDELIRRVMYITCES